MERRFLIGSKKTGKIYTGDELLAEVSDFLLSIKIRHQALDTTIKIISSSLFQTRFSIDGGSIVKIKDNPFYFVNKKYFSKMYWDNNLVATVSLDKVLDPDGVSLEVAFSGDIEEKHQRCLMVCYLATALNVNI
ncbi:hypothetical protein [Flavobacterium sp.]|uniref:hypothetical protein n=1 Tax=Flavobacterium sp. TaxID=239 RepID=UPI0039E425E7